jgi:hypothetical protein
MTQIGKKKAEKSDMNNTLTEKQEVLNTPVVNELGAGEPENSSDENKGQDGVAELVENEEELTVNVNQSDVCTDTEGNYSQNKSEIHEDGEEEMAENDEEKGAETPEDDENKETEPDSNEDDLIEIPSVNEAETDVKTPVKEDEKPVSKPVNLGRGFNFSWNGVSY